MTVNWEFQHSFVTRASRSTAWVYWSDLRNHEEEPGVERIELDGPFETSTTGRTIHTDFVQEWELTDVDREKRFVMTGLTPDGKGTLSFDWEFEDEDDGTRMTQRIRATGPDVEKYMAVFRQMETDAPKGMAQLCDKLDQLADETASVQSIETDSP